MLHKLSNGKEMAMQLKRFLESDIFKLKLPNQHIQWQYPKQLGQEDHSSASINFWSEILDA